jgi:transcriptional regulator with XRE-family HTH domain
MSDASGSSRKSVFSPQYERFREELIAMRKANRLSQQQVAQALGRPQSFVAKVENGERRLDIVELVGYARAIGAEPRNFIVELLEKIGEPRR